MDDSKQKITEKFIELLEFEGWNQQTLERACAEAGFETNYTNILYPGRIAEFTHDFVVECNREALAKAGFNGLDKMKTTKKAEEIIFQRINQYHNKLRTNEALKKFAAYCANPVNLTASLRNVYEFSSEAWYAIGDKSTDFSYYTKRISFSSIYTKCFLYSLGDKSDNLQETRKFIQKSIDALMKINKLKQSIKQFISYLPIKKYN